jgi:threonine/homoserine/homoserine lactone efflux protein
MGDRAQHRLNLRAKRAIHRECAVVGLHLRGLTALGAVSAWAGFGSSLRRFLSVARRAFWFNRAMGLALVVSVVPIILSSSRVRMLS